MAVLCLTLGSCLQEPVPEPEKDPLKGLVEDNGELSTAKIVLAVEKAATSTAYRKMKSVSPNTGHTPKYSYDADEIVYDRNTQQATVPLKVTWRAKTAELSFTTGTCEISGQLLINFSNRKLNVITATYVPSTYNEWAYKCAGSYSEGKTLLLKPLTFDPYK